MNVLIFAAALKVLTIGNSFSVQMVNALPPVAQNMGLELDICSLYIGGCTLERHWKNVCNPTNKPYSVTRCTNGMSCKGFAGNIPDMLKAEKWDVVTIQQGSHESWRAQSYHPYGDNLVKTVRELAPQAKIYVHETWSYTPWDGRLEDWKIDQNEMYAKLHAAYGDFAKQYGFEVIPTGTAVQLWRKELPVKYAEDSLGGDVVGRLKFTKDEATGKIAHAGDPFHMNGSGNHLQALVWAAKLFGVDVTKCNYEPKEIDKDKLPLMRKVAMEAVNGMKNNRPVASSELYKDGDVVVFFGDSITHGGRYHEYITDYYRTRFPEARIRFVNSGIGGDTAAGAFKRIPEDITEYAPTHVAFHFGMNDIGRGSYLQDTTSHSLVARDRAQTDYRKSLRRLINGVRQAAPKARFTYLTPTPYDDTAIVTNAPKSGWASINQVGCNLGLSLMAGYVIANAQRDRANYVDWYSVLNSFLLRHQRKDPCFSIVRPDRVHPEELGHSIMAWEFLKRQGVPALVSAVAIDAKDGVVISAENADVTACESVVKGVNFTLLAKALPFPVHEKALPYLKEFDVEQTLNREIVKVTGLAAGTYALKIDDVEVGRYGAAEFAKGISLGFNAKTPQYRQAQEVAKRNAELRGREAVLRNHHSARWAFFGRAPVDDIVAFKAWYEKDLANGGKVANDYFGKFIPGYLEYWPNYKSVREELWKDQDAVRGLAKPMPHRYEIIRVSK